MTKNLHLLIFFIVICFTSHAQENEGVGLISSSLKSYIENKHLEKVYIHTDRKYYSPGDFIWFQAYLVNGNNNQPSEHSKVIWVDLYDSHNDLVVQQKIYSDSGFGYGQIEIPDEVNAGRYILKAYTQWMKNSPEEFMFEKELMVVRSILEPSTISSSIPDLQFFPEGGHLVENINSQVAFKVMDNSGKGIGVSGKVIDESGQIVTQFSTLHNGMGVFDFKPEPNKSYHTIIDGYKEKYQLPPAQSQGFVLGVDNSTKQVFKITVKTSNPQTNQAYSLLIHSQGTVIYALEPRLNRSENVLTIPKIHFPEGMAHITLFDSKKQVIADRVIYIKTKKTDISLDLDASSYSYRSKVNASLKISNKQPVSAVFSMSVVDLGQTLDSLPQNTIVSDLLLTSDIKGYVENPMYYFDESNPSAEKHLDLLMMVHGWTRFSWEDVLNSTNKAPLYSVEKGLTVKGTILNLRGKKVEPEGSLTFLNQGVIPPMLRKTESRDDGSFILDDLEYYEGDDVIFQVANKKGSPYVKLELDTSEIASIATKPVSKGSFETLVFSNEEINSFYESKTERQKLNDTYDFDSTKFRDLGSFVVLGKQDIQKKGNDNSVYGSSDYTIDYTKIDVSPYFNPFQVLQGRIPGVKVEIGGTDVKISVRNAVGYDKGQPWQQLMPLIMLDDQPMRYQELTSLPVVMIERVEVYKGNSVSAFGSQGGAGVMAFYTKTQGEILDPPDKAKIVTTTLPNGYNKPLEFYSPKYEVQKPEHAKPDKRLLIHWQPMIFLDNDWEVPLEFWNTDESTDVLINIQGLTTNGEVFNINKTYKIAGQ